MAEPPPAPRKAPWRLSDLGRVLFIGLAIREAFSFWTGHPYDFEVWIRTGHAVATGSNPYAQSWPSLPVSIGYLGQALPPAAYLPFWPLVTGGLYRLWEAVGFGNRFALYFLLKQPGILADILTAFLLYRLARDWTSDPARGLAAARYWAYFPYAIVISAVWGQFDSIAVDLILATWVYRRSLERNVLWGLGILVKWVTAIFLPLEIFRARGTRRLAFLVGVALPIAATLGIFAALGWSTTHLVAGSISQTHGGGYGMNLALLFSIEPLYSWLSPVPYLYFLASWLYVPGVLIAALLAARWARGGSATGELRAYLLVVAVFLLLRWGLYEQYLLYLFSLLVLDVIVLHPERRGFLTYLFGLTSLDLIVNNDLGLRFLSPLDPGISSYVSVLDNTGAYGLVRTDLLAVLAVVVTLSLVQLIRAIWRDDPTVSPWIGAWVRPLLRRLRPGVEP